MSGISGTSGSSLFGQVRVQHRENFARWKGHKETTALMCLFNLTGFVMVPPLPGPLAMTALFVGISFGVLWFYWEGRNWSRILVMLTSVIALLNLVVLPKADLILQVIIVGEALLGAYLLYWLTRPPVVSFFKGQLQDGATLPE